MLLPAFLAVPTGTGATGPVATPLGTAIREQDSVPGCGDEHGMHATCASHNAPVGPSHRREIGEAAACGFSPLNPFARVQFALADGTESAELRGEAFLGQHPRLVRALHVDHARLRHEGRPLGQAAGMPFHRQALLVSRGIREGRVPPASACPHYCRVEPMPTICHVNGGAAAERIRDGRWQRTRYIRKEAGRQNLLGVVRQEETILTNHRAKKGGAAA